MRRTRQRLALAAAVLGLSLAGAVAAAAQQAGTVVGQVTDAGTQRPLASAQVFIVGTQRGALTNADGRFVIPQVPAGARTVKVTVLGYSEGTRAVTVTAGASVTANFALAQSAVELNAVVVNAITGQAERKKVIGANVTNIPVASINKGQLTTFQDVLNGRTAGIDMHATTGSIGASQKIRIRGANSLSLSNEPLIFVDGIQYNNSSSGSFGVGGQDLSRLSDLNPDDIANIEVLKGPAASSMYGTAAANGVLLITTTRGRAGKATWQAFAETGSISDKTTYPTSILAYHLNTPGAPLVRANGTFDSSARTPCYTFNAAQGLCTQDSLIVREPLRDPRTGPFITGFRNNFGLSVAGGTDAATYFFSTDMVKEQGVISYNTNKQLNFRSNVDAHLRPNLDVNVSAGYTAGNLSLNGNDNNVFSPLINGLMGSAIYYPKITNAAGDSIMNPRNFGFNYGIQDLAYYPTFQDINHFVLGSRATWRALPWLSANANVGMDLGNIHNSNQVPPNSPLGTLSATYMQGWRQSEHRMDATYTFNSSGTAQFDLMPSLNSATTVGVSFQKSHVASTYGYGVGLVAGTANLGATSSQFSVNEVFSELIQLGAFAQEKLAWKERVYLTAGMRTDDNSAFGKRYGRIYYPSAAASWLISQEPFMPKFDWLSTLRLRAAWGVSGLRPVFRQAVTYYNPVSTTVNGSNLSSVTLQATGNELLKPERTTEYEGGLDVGLFSERVNAEFTYFNKRSADALVAKPLPPSLGLTATQMDNLGSVKNVGTELSLTALAINRTNLRANLRLSATTLANKVISLGSVLPYSMTRGNQKVMPGYTIAGYWQQKYTYNDANHDGKLSPAEVVMDTTRGPDGTRTSFIGPLLPKFTRSLSGDVTFMKYITVSTLFDWRGGNIQSNQTESFRCNSDVGKTERGCTANMDPKAPLAEQARFIAYRYYGSYWGYDEKADFIKWRELSVTFAAPEVLASRLGFARNASLTFSGRNLKTWTDYTGLDPEVNEIGSSNLIQDEFNTQPPLRYYTVRLNFQF